jgi:DNA-binding SARP family transcriptional activator
MAEVSIERLEELVARHPYNEGYQKRLAKAKAEVAE